MSHFADAAEQLIIVKKFPSSLVSKKKAKSRWLKIQGNNKTKNKDLLPKAPLGGVVTVRTWTCRKTNSSTSV